MTAPGSGRPQPVIRTSRLVLRPFDAGDAKSVEEYVSKREVADTTLNIPHPYPKDSAAEWIATHSAAWEEGRRATWAITEAQDGSLIGAIALALAPEHARAELGYWIGPPFWNQGYGTEAARALLDFAFNDLKLNRVQAHYFIRNPSSGRIMEKIGMRLEGVNRQAIRKWDRFEDLAMYAILAEEWRQNQTESPQ